MGDAYKSEHHLLFLSIVLLIVLFVALSEDEIYSENHEDGGDEVVPAELHVESNGREDNEDSECNNFLNYLELHQVERAAVAFKTNSVGRYLKAVFKECNQP